MTKKRTRPTLWTVEIRAQTAQQRIGRWFHEPFRYEFDPEVREWIEEHDLRLRVEASHVRQLVVIFASAEDRHAFVTQWLRDYVGAFSPDATGHVTRDLLMGDPFGI